MTAWHPVLAADEQTPGVWFLTAQTGPYALVRIITIQGERGYRATTYAEPRQLSSATGAPSAAHANSHTTHGSDNTGRTPTPQRSTPT